MDTQNTNKVSLKPVVLASIIFGLFFLATGFLASRTILKVRGMNNTISVTGSATKDVVSDKAKLYISFSRGAKTDSLTTGYDQMKKDANAIVSYLKSKGITGEEINVGSVNAEDVWDQNERARKDYTLRQSIEVNTTKVNLVDTLSKEITSLAVNGIVLNVMPTYTYSKLADERVSMLSSAIDDAKARAEAIASKSGSSVGRIQNASNGVVQVLSPGSTEVQDYGSYDTSTINKTIMVTTKVSFLLK